MYLIVQVSLYKNILLVKIITTDTVMQTMRELFNVSTIYECRLWRRNDYNSYDLLKPQTSLLDENFDQNEVANNLLQSNLIISHKFYRTSC